MKFIMVILMATVLGPVELYAQARSQTPQRPAAKTAPAQRSKAAPSKRTQAPQKGKSTQRPQSSQKAQHAPAESRYQVEPNKAFPKLGASYKYWNERVEGERAGTKADIEMQFTGLAFHHSYNKYIRTSSWRRVFGLEIAGGIVKGKGSSGIIGDGLKDQPWASVTIAPALVKRFSEASELGLGVPISYRFISWKLKDSQFSMDKGASYSLGGELYLLNNFSPHSAIRVTLAQQYQWETTLFTVGYEWRPDKFLLAKLFGKR
jgi:hypothetical protein